jgi:hypothetical protein
MGLYIEKSKTGKQYAKKELKQLMSLEIFGLRVTIYRGLSGNPVNAI